MKTHLTWLILPAILIHSTNQTTAQTSDDIQVNDAAGGHYEMTEIVPHATAVNLPVGHDEPLTSSFSSSARLPSSTTPGRFWPAAPTSLACAGDPNWCKCAN